jgi:hypothetical protein
MSFKSYLHDQMFPPPDQHAQVICYICRGTGKIYLEHADGSLSEQVCEFCGGAKNSAWIREGSDRRESVLEWKKIFLGLFSAAVLFSFSPVVHQQHFWTASPGIKIVHFVLLVLTAIALYWDFCHPSPKKYKKPRRGPNPLTTDHEKLMAGVVVGGAVVKAELHRYHKQQQQHYNQQQQRPQLQQPQQLPKSPAQWW